MASAEQRRAAQAIRLPTYGLPLEELKGSL